MHREDNDPMRLEGRTPRRGPRVGAVRVRSVLIPFVLVGVLGGAVLVWAIVTDLTLVGQLHMAAAEHADQQELFDLVVAGDQDEAFEGAFKSGQGLFATAFNALDGAGANVGAGQRFSRVPRADLDGPGEWTQHVPPRTSGPNAQACTECHRHPYDDGAGPAAANVLRDPGRLGHLRKFIQRNPPHLFALGAIQRAAEEMTDALQAIRTSATTQACAQGGTVTLGLSAKGVDFGSVKATRISTNPCQITMDTSGVKGVDPDLVIKPLQWKGSVAFIRDFVRSEAHEELGMQAVEIVGDDGDGDFDAVGNEMSIGDPTALVVYLAAQPRPTTKVELSSLGLIPSLSDTEVNAIARGSLVFQEVGCASCHLSVLALDDPVFSEPSQRPAYRDATFPAGQDPVSRLVDPSFAVTFDLTSDQPDNQIEDAAGNVTFRLGSLRTDDRGHALVELWGDLKRHKMGAELAEAVDEVGTGKASFLTENLWGVGSTPPYLHDGRATTLTEAILEHGGEASASRAAFLARATDDQASLIAFLSNLVLFKAAE